jgi:aspartyl-tRNA(Asn)/glutamyl-tRNA(Gln) amidotransferase subunit A
VELFQTPAHILADKLRTKEVSSSELTKAVLARISQVDPKVHAFITVTEEEALQMAADADQRLARGENVQPLTGIPVGLKDIFLTKGVLTTCASRILNNFIAPYDATVVSKLRDAGAVFVGKLNMDEFAMGSSTENSAYGVTRNPWDLERIPGGSSGGSSAALAAGESIITLGTDTGGSIRQPASVCGVVGIKPTYGRVSRYGVIAFASSLDQVGPFALDVEDCAIALESIAGHDPRDSTSAPAAVPDFRADLKKGVKGLKIGVPKEYFVEGMDPEVEKAVHTAIDALKQQGAEVVEVSLPHTEYAVATYYLVAPAEASSNLARYDGVRFGYRAAAPENLLDMYMRSRGEGFGPEVKRRIMIGTYALSSGYYDAYYLKAQKVRTLLKQDFDEAFKQVDVIVTPTAPSAAFKIGEKSADPLQMYLSDIFTIACNLAGIPGISLPCGFTSNNLPIGLQLLGKAWDEATLFRVGWAYEQSQDWHKRRAQL